MKGYGAVVLQDDCFDFVFYFIWHRRSIMFWGHFLLKECVQSVSAKNNLDIFLCELLVLIASNNFFCCYFISCFVYNIFLY